MISIDHGSLMGFMVIKSWNCSDLMGFYSDLMEY